MAGWDQDQAMIEAQAHQITKLRADYTHLREQYHKEVGDHARNMKAAEFYYSIQRAVLKNPILQSEWARFCSFLKMAIEDEQSMSESDVAPEVVPEDNNIPNMI